MRIKAPLWFGPSLFLWSLKLCSTFRLFQKYCHKEFTMTFTDLTFLCTHQNLKEFIHQRLSEDMRETFLYWCVSLAPARAPWHMAPYCKFFTNMFLLPWASLHEYTAWMMGQSILDWCSLIFNQSRRWHSFHWWRWECNICSL